MELRRRNSKLCRFVAIKGDVIHGCLGYNMITVQKNTYGHCIAIQGRSAYAQKIIMPTKLNSVALIRKRTIPTERPLLGEVSAKFCG
jgi:hypothetical protein